MHIAETIREIVLPETEPATEWILEEPAQKVSPKRRHALVQGAISEILRSWARGRGDAGPEWRFRITPPGEYTRPFVPDVAYLSNERKAGLTGEDLEQPRIAPDLVVEIRSPDDPPNRLEHKRNIYLAAGVRLVLIVDPGGRTLEAFDKNASTAYAEPEIFSTPLFPGLEIPLTELFAQLD